MTFSQHLTKFAGKKVYDYSGGKLENPKTSIPRLRVEYDDDNTAVDLLTELLQQPTVDQLYGIVIGQWVGEMIDTDPSEVIETLVAGSDQLPNLRAIFLGEIVYQENEISWIQQCDISAIWEAFPRLEVLQVRGSNNLSLGRVAHDALKSLVIESGGLPISIIQELEKAKLPSLEHLELYLGSDNYGWNGSVKDLKKILSGKLFPKLKYLGLRDSEIVDEVAAAAAKAPILERLETLDLSLGTLTDAGAQHLLDSSLVPRLKLLDLHHHFCTPAMVKKLKKLPIKVDVSDVQEARDYGDGEVYRYISVSE